MGVEKAKAYYSGKDGSKRLNCGQAIIKMQGDTAAKEAFMHRMCREIGRIYR